MKKVAALDGLRGLASLLVLWVHFPVLDGGIIFQKINFVARSVYSGYIGVDIFFALSGFLITRILLREKETNQLSFGRFYFKRFLRIFPVYYLVILLVGFVISWSKVGWSALYLSNYYFSFYTGPSPLRHTWSLCVEQHYYLFWPFIIGFFSLSQSKKIITYIIPAAAILSSIFIMLYIKKDAVELINKATNVRILTLSLGSLLAYYESKIYSYNFRYCLLLMILFFGCTLSCHFVSNVILMSFGRYIFSAFFSFFFLSTILIMSVKNIGSPVIKFFEGSVMRFFGNISYGLYLFHYPILFYFGAINIDEVKTVPVQSGLFMLFLCLLFPTISYYFFEKPLLKFKSRYSLVKKV